MLLSTHSTCELSSVCVRRAYASTPSFNMVEESSICAAYTVRYRLWTVINTFVLCAMMSLSF